MDLERRNTPNGVSKEPTQVPGIPIPSSEKKLVATNDSLPEFPPRKCLANIRKTWDDLIHCWPLKRIGVRQISGKGLQRV